MAKVEERYGDICRESDFIRITAFERLEEHLKEIERAHYEKDVDVEDRNQ